MGVGRIDDMLAVAAFSVSHSVAEAYVSNK